VERLTRRDVRIDFGVRDVSEGDFGMRHYSNTTVVLAASMIDEPVAGIQDTRSSALTQPALAGDLGEVGLSVNDSVDDERRIATENESVNCRSVRFGDGLRLRARQQFDHFGGFEVTRRGDDSVLIDTGGNGQWFDTGRAKSRKTSR
jgi:hypothetical protein